LFGVTTIGTLRANEVTAIVPEISKKVISVVMKEGAFVEQGDLLFRLDDSDLLARMVKLRIEERLAAANEAREKALLTKGGISQERYDEVLNHLERIRADIGILEVDLSKTEIRTPFSGRLGLRNVSPGAMVDPSVVLTTLQDTRIMKIDFTVPERVAGSIRPGMRITFTTDDAAGSYQAIVEAGEPAIDLRTRTLTVRGLVISHPGDLTPGASVKVGLDAGGASAGIYLPSACLIPSQQGYGVFLYKNGKAKRQMVSTGMRGAGMVMIREGVVPGDTVIATGLLKIHEDASVRIIKTK
jgi:membrane fusion protein (multidrug efflux system)